MKKKKTILNVQKLTPEVGKKDPYRPTAPLTEKKVSGGGPNRGPKKDEGSKQTNQPGVGCGNAHSKVKKTKQRPTGKRECGATGRDSLGRGAMRRRGREWELREEVTKEPAIGELILAAISLLKR